MKIMDKLKFQVKIDKKLLIFLTILLLVGIAFGSIFVSILDNSDKTLVNEHLNNFINSIETDKLDYFQALKSNLITNISFVIVIWLLGISIIGLPIILIMFFSKTFILGFSVGAILSVFKTKGLLFSLVHIFPGQVISLLLYLLLTMYAMSFSFKLIYVIFKKKTLDFKIVMNKYFKILLLVLTIVILMNLYDTYLMPKLVKILIPFIK